MATKSKAEYDMQYAKMKLKRIPLNIQKEQYEQLKEAVEASGDKKVNTYVKKAIAARMESEGFTWPGDQKEV